MQMLGLQYRITFQPRLMRKNGRTHHNFVGAGHCNKCVEVLTDFLGSANKRVFYHLQRAINAFSYLFSNINEKDSSNLFWIMLGIEALLAEDAHNIINQIKTKTSLILGEPTEYKKKLDKLYNYR